MRSSDGKTRSVVTDIPGSGWDYSITRHPYHEHERSKGAHYCVYNRRLMAVCFDDHSVEDGYWRLRREAACLHTGELPIEFKGPDAERLLDKLFTKDITKAKVGRCGYGLACYEDGGLIVDGVFLRLDTDRFWYVQADGDFYSWARAHASGMEVDISDPDVFVSQIQGPNSLKILEAAAGGLPEKFTYFGIARVNLGGQDVIISRTGYTNELGWEFYTEPHHDADALWAHLKKAGEPYGLDIFGLDAMNIRRIEAGILNAGADFNASTSPFAVGFERFVDMEKTDFIGKSALEEVDKRPRSFGIQCKDGQPLISGAIHADGTRMGTVTAGATSPYLGCGIGIALLDAPSHGPGAAISVACADGSMQPAELVSQPMYDAAWEIPRGKLIDIPPRV